MRHEREETVERQKYPYYKIRNKSEEIIEIEIIRKKSKMPSINLKKNPLLLKKEKVNKKTIPISPIEFIH